MRIKKCTITKCFSTKKNNTFATLNALSFLNLDLDKGVISHKANNWNNTNYTIDKIAF